MYTDRSILEVLVKNEDRDVWRAKLEKGEYSSALGFVKVSLIYVEQGRVMCADEIVGRTTRYRTLETG